MGFWLPQKDKYLSTTCKINKRATYARWENCNAKTVPDSLIFPFVPNANVPIRFTYHFQW